MQISKKQLLVLFGGVTTFAFLGMVAGGYIAEKRISAFRNAKPDTTFLKIGQDFPSYNFLAFNDQFFKSNEKLIGKKSVLIFLTTDCGHCVQMIERWNFAFSQIGPEYQIFGISFEPLEKLKQFQANHKINIPLYNDLNGKFTGEYKIERYPTIVGVNEKGKIAFMEFGNRPQNQVQDYLKMF